MGLAAGQRLGVYEIVGPLGAGGMGEVYRARDTRLSREVAIKVLPEYVSVDATRLKRFEQEAQVLASLNHPGIAALYSVEESTGAPALVMELVQGQTLLERLVHGPMAVEEALPIARQIAEALEYAHEHGIIHRDLKPANVKLLPDGGVKVLDFGLAKALEAERESGNILSSPTLTAAATKMGQIMGTAAYMSPEQAKAKSVDRRSDVWSFGCVLFEMLTGKLAFSGETVTDTLAAVVRGEPDWTLLPTTTPPGLRRLIERCLRKDVKARLQAMGDARIALEEVASGIDGTGVAAAPVPVASANRSALWWAALAIVAVVAAGATLLVSNYSRPRPAPTRLSIAVPAGQVITGPPAISRDGRQIAYPAKDVDGATRLYVRALDSYEAKVIPNSEGAMLPFFSPEGGRIGFFAKGKLLTASLAGGPPTAIAAVSYLAFGGSWGDDDTIIYAPALTYGLYRIPAAGGKPQQLTQPDEGEKGYAHMFPQWMPGGRHVLFGIWGGVNLGGSSAALLSLETGKWILLATVQWTPQYARSGHLLLSGVHGVTALSFDGKNPPKGRAPTFVLENVFASTNVSNSWFAVSDSGTLAYVPGNTDLSTPAWVDREGRLSPILNQPESFSDPALSPDGTKVVLSVDLWIFVLDLQRGTRTRITQENEGSAMYPFWSRDGKNVIFGSNRSGDWELYAAPANGGEARRLLTRKGAQFPLSQAPDGTILFSDRAKGADHWTLAPDGTAKPFLVSPASKTAGQFSPNGRLVAYVSDESGRNEVYVRSTDNSEDAIEVSNDGGREPLWSHDGKELFYRSGDSFMVVNVMSSGAVAVGTPKKMFELKGAGPGRSPMHAGYAVSPDDKRFLVLRLDPRAIPTQINVVENWFEELKAKVPAK